jgi:hypothetical protein
MPAALIGVQLVGDEVLDDVTNSYTLHSTPRINIASLRYAYNTTDHMQASMAARQSSGAMAPTKHDIFDGHD